MSFCDCVCVSNTFYFISFLLLLLCYVLMFYVRVVCCYCLSSTHSSYEPWWIVVVFAPPSLLPIVVILNHNLFDKNKNRNSKMMKSWIHEWYLLRTSIKLNNKLFDDGVKSKFVKSYKFTTIMFLLCNYIFCNTALSWLYRYTLIS